MPRKFSTKYKKKYKGGVNKDDLDSAKQRMTHLIKEDLGGWSNSILLVFAAVAYGHLAAIYTIPTKSYYYAKCNDTCGDKGERDVWKKESAECMNGNDYCDNMQLIQRSNIIWLLLFTMLMLRNGIGSKRRRDENEKLTGNEKLPDYEMLNYHSEEKGGRGLPTCLLEGFILFGLILHFVRIYQLEMPEGFSGIVIILLISIVLLFCWSEGILFSNVATREKLSVNPVQEQTTTKPNT